MNRIKNTLFLLILLISPLSLSAQQKNFVMEGTVYDESGIVVPGATVYIKDKISIGTFTDTQGKFNIKEIGRAHV
jgi:outer membrane receptor for ferrienterochelin and colicins